MANATVTNSNGVCKISIPKNLHSVHLLPKTSGNAQFINYCSWSDDTNKCLGEWSAHQKNIEVLSNEFDLISSKTKIGTMTEKSDPSVKQLSLAFTYQTNKDSPIESNLIKVTVENITEDLTVIVILAEDKNDHNYLDFQMIVVIKDN